MSARHQARLRSTVAVGIAAVLALTGCASGGGDGADAPAAEAQYTQADIDAALEEGADLTYWGWCPQCQGMVDAFNEQYPNMNVTLQNQGSGGDQYSKFQNVLAAGSGIPDVVQLEFTAMPQFALAGNAIIDFNEYGLAESEELFAPAFWEAANYQGALYGLPQDAGPMVMFYREDIFTQYGLTVPETWDEYIEAARALKEAAPDYFIAADAGDPGMTNAYIWQAGGRPYSTEDTTVSVDFGDDGTARYLEFEQTLIEEGLVDTATAGFTPEWNAGLASGKYATLITGAWGSGTLQRRIPEASGKWRVAPMPQHEAGENVSSQNGGSMTTVTQASENKLAAVGFVQWMAATDEGSQVWTDLAGFPCYAPTLESDEWLNVEMEYFGGQQANQIFAESAANVGEGWQFLPFQPYANSIFSDSVGGAYVGDTDLTSGLEAWKESIDSYASSQGFDVAD